MAKKKANLADDSQESAAKKAATAPAAPVQEAEEKPAKKRGIPKLVIYAAAFLVMMVASFLLQKTLFFSNPAVANSEAETEHEEPKKKDSKKEEEAPIVMLDELIVNPADTGGRRYLAVTMGLQLQKKEQEADIEKNTVLIRDALITLLSSKQMDQLSSTAYRDTLRSEIRDAVNSQLKAKPVKHIVFSSYVLQ